MPGARTEKQGDFHGKPSRLIQRLEGKRTDRRLRFLFLVAGVAESYKCLDEAVMLRGRAFKGAHGGVKVINFSEVPSDILPLIVGTVARAVFYVQQWSAEGRASGAALFCDEAHPNNRQDATSGAAENGIATFERIAKEGRKYGAGLVVISQRCLPR